MQAEGSQTQLPTRQSSPLWGLPLPREKRPALPRYATYLFCCISRCHRASPGTPQTPGHLPPGPGCPQWLRRARHPPARTSPGSSGSRGEGRFSSGRPSSTSYLEAAPQPPSTQEWAGQELLEEGGAQRSRQGGGGVPREWPGSSSSPKDLGSRRQSLCVQFLRVSQIARPLVSQITIDPPGRYAPSSLASPRADLQGLWEECVVVALCFGLWYPDSWTGRNNSN